MTDAAPTYLSVDLSGVPGDLEALDQWVNWDLVRRKGRWTKPPKSARTGGSAASDDPSTWAPFELAAARSDRIGFVPTRGGGIFFVDLDKCRDPETGEITPWARAIVARFERRTYVEPSPSGTGLKVIGYGHWPHDSHITRVGGGQVEVFEGGKYTTITGRRLDGARATLGECQDALDALHAELFAEREQPPAPNGHRPPTALTDVDVVELAMNAKNGEKFRRLYLDGDTAPYGADDSAADEALACLIAFYTCDPGQVERVFERSALGQRDKWRKRADYRTRTISRALELVSETYSPPKPKKDTRAARSSANGTGGAPTPDCAGDRPSIDAGDHDLERVSAQAWHAVELSNDPPRLFCFGRLPVRIEGGAEGDAPIAQPLSEHRFRYEVARSAHWYRETKDRINPAAPPLDVIRDMLAAPSYPLPVLDAIVQTPTFALDGSLETEPGYHAASRTYYAPPPGLRVSAVPDPPTEADVGRARSMILDDLLADFPFLDACERANAVALVLLPYVRNLIAGPTPLHSIEAPTPGSGKGLLADVALRPAIGQRVNVMPAPSEDDEWRKRITAQLCLMPAAILIDNVTKALDSGALSSALTAGWWTDRRLGANEMVHVPVRCVWAATANNPTMSTELARRTVRIRLDPKIDRPWQRTQFRHTDLRSWVDDNRSALVWSALTLVRHWVRDGMPEGGIRLGSFERWSAVLGGVLASCEIDGFLGNLETFYESADLEGAIWRQFVALWFEQFGEAEVGVAELFGMALNVEGLDLGLGNERSQKTAFGVLLNRQRDRVIGDFRIVNTRTVNRVKRWRLIRARSGDNPFAAFYDDQPADEQTDADAGDQQDGDRWTQ